MPAQARRQLIIERGSTFTVLAASTRHPLGWNGGVPAAASGHVGPGAFYLEPDDYIGTKLRLRVSALTNATAPVADFTIAICPITAVAGGVGVVSFTAGAVIAASQVVITAPGIGSMIRQESAEFDWPVAGWYAFSIINSAQPAANACTQLTFQLEAR